MRVVLSWSSGKDSAWALYQLQKNKDVELVGLLTTLNDKFRRVAMHGVREELLDAQAQAADLPLFKVPLPWPCSNEDYENIMRTTLSMLKEDHDVTHIAFGDLFLEDVRQYRIDKMKQTDIEPIFPIWGMSTKELSKEMISKGLSAYLTCVDPKQLSEKFIGAHYDEQFLSLLDEDVDPCGENGEFHTFVNAGPMFNTDIDISVGEIVNRDGFYFADLKLSKQHL